MHFMQRSLQYAFMDAPSRLVFTVVLRPFLRRLRPNHKTVLQGVVEKFVELLEPEAADLYDAFQLKQENKAADGEEDDEDDEDSDKELPWFALQAFRQSLGGDAGRTTGGRTRRTSPTKRSRKSRSRKSSMGTVATPRKKLDMGDGDDGSQQATPTPKRKRASTGSQSAPRNAAQSHASPASDAEFRFVGCAVSITWPVLMCVWCTPVMTTCNHRPPRSRVASQRRRSGRSRRAHPQPTRTAGSPRPSLQSSQRALSAVARDAGSGFIVFVLCGALLSTSCVCRVHGAVGWGCSCIATIPPHLSSLLLRAHSAVANAIDVSMSIGAPSVDELQHGDHCDPSSACTHMTGVSTHCCHAA